MTLRQHIKSATGGNVWLRYAFLAPWRLAYAAYTAATGNNIAGHHEETPAEINQYARRIFAQYRSWAGVARFHGRVAELGPGNVLSIAEMFLADGCIQVDQVDRYAHFNGNAANPAIQRYQQPAETFFASHRGYDFIVSCAVMEHLYDPIPTVRAMAEALSPGGMMLHVIDCRDHGQFSDRLHDLSFLRIPRALYWPLTLASGLNRVRLSAYLHTLRECGLSTEIRVTNLSGIAPDLSPALPLQAVPVDLISRSRSNLSSIKTRLAKPYREMPDEELMISCFALIARRASGSPQAKS